MKIDNHNLDDALLAAIKDDLKAVEKAPARKRPLPQSFIYIVVLELGSCPADIPPHQLKVPDVTPPMNFKERCD